MKFSCEKAILQAMISIASRTVAPKSAIPALEGGQETLYTIRGTVPDLRCPPPGCRFCPRCDRATEACAQSVPPLRDVGGGHFVRCFQVT